MACYHPLRAYRGSDGSVFFSQLARTGAGDPIDLPCGRCIGCRLERSRQWAMRCQHEASLYKRNCFLTLTYADGKVPEDGSLNYRHFQLFVKRLRKAHPRDRVRFFMCGEYGERLGRPHYHACLFNFDFQDKFPWRRAGEHQVWRSKLLESLWGFGFCEIGSVTFESAAYVARYIVDKVTGDEAEAHYAGRVPEFCHMSLKPGIGAEWFRRFVTDSYPHGKCVVNGKEVNPPKYYDKLFDRLSPLDMQELKDQREWEGYQRRADSTSERLAVREHVALARARQLKRSV